MNIDKVKAFLQDKGEFRYNKVRGTVELKTRDTSDVVIYNDFMFNSLRFELIEHGIDICISDLMALLHSDFSKPYHPIHTYLEDLPEWDESQPDYIKQLAETVKVDDPGFFERMLRIWLVAVVACAKDKSVNELVLVLSGAQGVGKTKWLLRLVPDCLKAYCSTGRVNFNDKDSTVNLAQCFMLIMDEMASFKKSSYADLKEWISKPFIRVRRPYGRTHEFMPRIGSFCGATNESTFLFDSTGSRRFLCFETNYINYQHDVPINMVYAQAKHLLDNHFNPYLTPEEISENEKHNRVFEHCSVEMELVVRYCKPTLVGQREYLMASEVLQKISRHEPHYAGKLNRVNIGKALKKLNFARKKFEGRYKYAVSVVEPELPVTSTPRRKAFDGTASEAVDKFFEGWSN